ncbi:hypothetical protein CAUPRSCDRAFT_12768 [Caulochytrium protostelioides]|nr:hypothetical protein CAUPRSCDRAFT_12768 [Caulochytrium protostelioides]
MDAARLAAAVGDAVPPAATRLGRLRRAARVALAASRARAVQHAHHVLPAGIMIYRFLEWWQTSELAQGPADPIPPPPPPLAPHPKGVAVPEDPRACPLCGAAPRVTPAALPSGYVFCYTCIVPSLQEHRRCPVTWAPMDVSAVRRLYVSD